MNKEILINLIKEEDIDWLLEENFKAILHLNNESAYKLFIKQCDKHLKNRILALLKMSKIETNKSYKALINNLHKAETPEILTHIVSLIENKKLTKTDSTYKYLTEILNSCYQEEELQVFYDILNEPIIMNSNYLNDCLDLLFTLYKTDKKYLFILPVIGELIETNSKHTSFILKSISKLIYIYNVYDIMNIIRNPYVESSTKFEDVINAYINTLNEKNTHYDTDTFTNFFNLEKHQNLFNNTRNDIYFFELDEFLNVSDAEIRKNIVSLVTNEYFINVSDEIFSLGLDKLIHIKREGIRREYVNLAITLSKTKNKFIKEILELASNIQSEERIITLTKLSTNTSLMKCECYMDLINLVSTKYPNAKLTLLDIIKDLDLEKEEYRNRLTLGVNTLKHLLDSNTSFSKNTFILIHSYAIEHKDYKEILEIVKDIKVKERMDIVMRALSTPQYLESDHLGFILKTLNELDIDISYELDDLIIFNTKLLKLNNFRKIITYISKKFTSEEISEMKYLLKPIISLELTNDIFLIKSDEMLIDYLTIIKGVSSYSSITLKEQKSILTNILSSSEKEKRNYLITLSKSSDTTILNNKALLYKLASKGTYHKSKLIQKLKSNNIDNTSIEIIVSELFKPKGEIKTDNTPTLIEEYRKVKTNAELLKLLETLNNYEEITLESKTLKLKLT